MDPHDNNSWLQNNFSRRRPDSPGTLNVAANLTNLTPFLRKRLGDNVTSIATVKRKFRRPNGGVSGCLLERTQKHHPRVASKLHVSSNRPAEESNSGLVEERILQIGGSTAHNTRNEGGNSNVRENHQNKEDKQDVKDLQHQEIRQDRQVLQSRRNAQKTHDQENKPIQQTLQIPQAQLNDSVFNSAVPERHSYLYIGSKDDPVEIDLDYSSLTCFSTDDEPPLDVYLAPKKKEGHKENNEMIKFSCYVYGKKYKTQNGLLLHLGFPTGEEGSNPLSPSTSSFLTPSSSPPPSPTLDILIPELTEKDKTHTCSICNKKTSTRGALVNHMKTHEKMEESQKETNTRASSSVELARTTPSIPTVNPHQCPYCDYSSHKPSRVREHMHTHTGKKPFQCQKCDKSFASRYSFSAHVKAHEQGYLKLTCPYCEKKLSRKDHLIAHLYTHTGDSPHKCDICKVTYNTKYSLNQHNKTFHA